MKRKNNRRLQQISNLDLVSGFLFFPLWPILVLLITGSGLVVLVDVDL